MRTVRVHYPPRDCRGSRHPCRVCGVAPGERLGEDSARCRRLDEDGGEDRQDRHDESGQGEVRDDREGRVEESQRQDCEREVGGGCDLAAPG
ncbi:hypothetical protein GCM10018780_24620 [Streptomyces lanatus]|nr:hypothetical protein GCM10018780_24620 [Streptomyces lanatus]